MSKIDWEGLFWTLSLIFVVALMVLLAHCDGKYKNDYCRLRLKESKGEQLTDEERVRLLEIEYELARPRHCGRHNYVYRRH